MSEQQKELMNKLFHKFCKPLILALAIVVVSLITPSMGSDQWQAKYIDRTLTEHKTEPELQHTVEAPAETKPTTPQHTAEAKPTTPQHTAEAKPLTEAQPPEEARQEHHAIMERNAIQEKPAPTLVAELRQKYGNDDIVAYLKIEDTNISYPVTQASDNEFYLNRDIYKKKNSAGTVYMDFENSVKAFSDNTVIYGHNMRNGSMFHNLRYYLKKQYYETHKYIHLTTPHEETVWEVFSFYQTTTDFYYIQTHFKNKKAFAALLSQMKSKTMYNTGVEVTENDKILTLSTCANEGGNKRYVLNAKLIQK